MKTHQQIKFEQLIAKIIQSNAYIINRKGLLEDFEEESDVCYDIFCAKIYDFFYEKTSGGLTIDERGYVHHEETKKLPHHVYFDLLSEADHVVGCEDVIYYIDLALERLEEQVEVICKAVNS